ncbi:MAG: epoxide hydrolase [Sinobacteraceae bacterium]|nr:epoxide hydrolase [Nevskiaceae bacterium]
MASLIRPYQIAVAEEAVHELRRRIAATRWPTSIESAGWAMGMDTAYLRWLAERWLNDFNWRAVEADLNGYPQFLAEVGPEPIHFVHLRGTGSEPIPIILTHGWPSTYAELLKLGCALAEPSGHGQRDAVSFDVVIPSLPGYGFSPAPRSLGTNVFTIADQWAALMSALGHQRFIAHGGDIGAGVSTALGLRYSDRLAGVHLTYIPGSYQPFLDPSTPNASALSAAEIAWQAQRAAWTDAEGGYAHVQGTKPDVLGPALNDSPVGLAAWIVDKYRSWSDCDGDLNTRFTSTDLLTVISIYWFSQSMPSAIRLYWEGRRAPMHLAAGERITVPVAVAHFPKELPIPPRSYVERGYNITRWTEFSRGGHFAALEETDELARDIRSFAREIYPR